MFFKSDCKFTAFFWHVQINRYFFILRYGRVLAHDKGRLESEKNRRTFATLVKKNDV